MSAGFEYPASVDGDTSQATIAQQSLEASTPLDRFLFVPLFCAYGFIVPFGNLGRVGEEESSQGISTVIVLILLLFGVTRWSIALVTNLVLALLLGLVLYLMIPSALMPDPIGALLKLIPFVLFILLAGTVSRSNLNSTQLQYVWIAIAAGVLMSSLLTVIDFAGVIDVPFNNETYVETNTGSEVAVQASGFFARRSAMAAIFSLGIAGSLVQAIVNPYVLRRLFFAASGIAGLLCLFLTHNRSGVFGPVVAIGLYLFVAPRFGGLQRLRVVAIGLAVAVLSIVAVVIFYPDTASVYVAKLGFLGLGDRTWDSDTIRLDLAKVALETLQQRPQGSGLTLIELANGERYNAHNLVTTIVWSAGVFAFFWLPVFGAALIFLIYRVWSNSPRGLPVLASSGDAFACALVAWLINGMAHNSLFTGLAWITLGMLIACAVKYARIPRQIQQPIPMSYSFE